MLKGRTRNNRVRAARQSEKETRGDEKPGKHTRQGTFVQPGIRTVGVEDHRGKAYKSGGSVITERLYIDIKQD